MSQAESSTPPPTRKWLLGPIPDLFLGTGLAYFVVFLWLAIDFDGAKQVAPMWLLSILVVVISMPHYGATLVRIYGRRADRRKYFFFTTYITLALIGAFFLGLYKTAIGSLIFTLYLTWSPWHYTGQNYGITLMFLYRNGVSVPAAVKRNLHLSFVVSFLLTFAFIHGDYAKRVLASDEIGFVSLGLPAFGVDLFILISIVAYGYLTLRALQALVSSSSWKAVAPAAALMSVHALWFVAPALYRNWSPLGALDVLSTREASYTFLWIAFGHAVQYLWITAYYAKASNRSRSHGSFYLKALFAGVAAWTIPALFFHPGWLGARPYDGGLALMIAAVVNLHHFILDGAIWKLRDGRLAKALLRTTEISQDSIQSPPATWSRWSRGAIAIFGVVIAIVAMWGIWEYHQTRSALERQDLPRAELGIERLRWIGRDSAELRLALGQAQAKQGRLQEGERQIRSSLDFYPTPKGWRALGDLYARSGHWREAISSYETALESWPESIDLRLRFAESLIALGKIERAERILEGLLSDVPNDGKVRQLMNQIQSLATTAESPFEQDR